MTLESIRSLVSEDLSATDEYIISQLESNVPMIRDILEYVLKSGGKRVRPLILLLSARAIGTKTTKHIDLAAVIELIHTATLLHDDVVDSSTLRRGHKTAHIVWGSDASILVGDFLYSRAFKIIADLEHPIILRVFANATHYMAEGEIMQLVNCHNPDTTESFYFDIIQRKTAKLFEIAAELGAILATNEKSHIEALKNYGSYLGLAYQLIDDALDYSQATDQTGKNIGQDISDGKTTLPLIYAMQHSEGKDLAMIREAITTGSTDNLKQILAIIDSTQAIKYTADAAQQYAQRARKSLTIIEDSPYRQALEELTHFIVERNY